jgi:hypothetical protein
VEVVEPACFSETIRARREFSPPDRGCASAMYLNRDGSGSGLERISADFGYVSCGFGSNFRPQVRGLGYPQHCGFGADSTFRPRISVGALKTDPNKPT